jgi:hypothetical protein
VSGFGEEGRLQAHLVSGVKRRCRLHFRLGAHSLQPTLFAKTGHYPEARSSTAG